MRELSEELAPCPRCGGAVLPLVYGYPSDALFEAADRGQVFLGGCCIEPEQPDGRCTVCGLPLQQGRAAGSAPDAEGRAGREG